MTKAEFKKGIKRDNKILVAAYRSALSDPNFMITEQEKQSMLNTIGILESPIELWAFKRKKR